MHAQRRQCVMYTHKLFQLLIKVPPLDTPLNLPLDHPNSLSRRTVTITWTYKSSTDNCAFINKIGALLRFFTEEWLDFTGIIGYKIVGGIANLLLPSRAAPALEYRCFVSKNTLESMNFESKTYLQYETLVIF